MSAAPERDYEQLAYCPTCRRINAHQWLCPSNTTARARARALGGWPKRVDTCHCCQALYWRYYELKDVPARCPWCITCPRSECKVRSVGDSGRTTFNRPIPIVTPAGLIWPYGDPARGGTDTTHPSRPDHGHSGDRW